LRAAAALSVALHHVTHDARALGPPGAALAAAIDDAMPWEAGVDIFFVISGFVMLHASDALFSRGLLGIRRFLARRIARIVPLYWTATTAFLIVTVAMPGAITASLGGWRDVIASYAFIPRARPDGLVQPVIGLGWTLNYEMFFYLLFAAFLWMPRRSAIRWLTICFAGVVAIGTLVGFSNVALNFWSAPIVLEFVFGVWIRALLPTLGTPAVWLRVGMVAVAIAVFRLDLVAEGVPPLIGYGLPATLLVIASVTGARDRVSAWTSVAVRIGDASYALYLLHPFVMRAGSLAARRLGLASPGAVLMYIVMSLVVSCLVALAVNTVAEHPATRYARQWL
jgi:exopolysaccharide production protein ExoZ